MTAQLADGGHEVGIVAHQAAVNCILSIRVHRCYLVARRQLQYFVAIAWGLRKREVTDDERVSSLLDKGREGGLEVEMANFQYNDLPPQRTPAASMSLFRSSKIGELEGPERYAIVVALGISSSKRLSCLPASSAVRKVIPVTVPPGRLRLVTRPYCTGSSATAKTIGIVEVAAFAARVAYGEPVVTITATLRSTRSAASRGRTES